MRLIHGDCLEKLKAIESNSIDAVVTDPPYGTTKNKWDCAIDLASLWNELLRVSKPNAAIVMFCAQPFTSVLINSQLHLFRYSWVWEKTTPTNHLNAKKQPLRITEDIAVFYCEQSPYFPQFTKGEPYIQKSGRASSNYGSQISVVTESDGNRYPVNLIRFSRDRDRHHPTQKPIDLMRYILRTYVPEGGVVLDPFMGSGSTGVAAKLEGFKFIGIERESEYHAIAEARIASAIALSVAGKSKKSKKKK